MALQYATKKDSVVEWLRGQILAGFLQPGTQLQQEDIAERLNVSSTPVREAFATLEAEGLVVSRPHRGVVVTEGNAREIEDIYAIRILIETRAIVRAGGHVTKEQARQLDQLNDVTAGAVKAADGQLFRQTSARFHQMVAAAGGPFYAEVSKAVIARSMHVLPLRRVRMHEALREHRLIAAALKKPNGGTAAERLMKTHLERNLAPLKGRAKGGPSANGA